MLIIGFSEKTSKPLVQLVCKHMKHCAIITQDKNEMFLHQFVSRCNVAKIAITERGIAQLESNGWVFIYIDKYKPERLDQRAMTCVQYAKYAIGIKKFWIQTPDALYKYLKKNLT